MNVWNSLRRLFGATETLPDAPKLRNRPGGMAWVKGLDHGNGTETLNRCAVRTVCLIDDRLWMIDPPLPFLVTRSTLYTQQGITIYRGGVASVTALGDDLLDPWRDIGDGEKDESAAWLPPVPRATPAELLGLRVREMGRAAHTPL